MKRYGLAVAALALALSACSSWSATAQKEPDSEVSADPSAAAPATGQEFGTECSQVPTDPADPGSFEAMAKVPVGTAAANNPQLSTLVAAVTAADLGDSLNTAEAVTVFAPTNAAMAKVPAPDYEALLADKTKLAEVLKYHVIPQRLSPDQLAGTHTTLQGGEVTVTGSGDDFIVNGIALVVCGNIQTSNGTVYMIDSVLLPT